jgi:hypothetical protein
MDIFLAIVVGFYLGYKVSEAYHKYCINDVLKDMGIDAKTRQEMVEHCRRELAAAEGPELIRIKVEQIQDQFYAFRKDNDQFIAQCGSREELIKIVQQKLGATGVIESNA